MINLNTNLTLETIHKSKELRNIWLSKFNCTKLIKVLYEQKDIFPLTIADVISNAEKLFGNYYFKNMAWLLIACDDNKPLKEIEAYVLSNIK